MSIRYRASCEDDLADLVTLRIAAMREGLEAIGRFDPERIERLMREPYCRERIIYTCIIFTYTLITNRWELELQLSLR